MIDALRSYLQLASGLAEATAGKARDAASALMAQGAEAGVKGPEMLSAQVQGIAEDLLEQSRTNRELLLGLVRTEVDRTVGRMGFVREEELAAVRRHVQRLEAQINRRSEQAVGAAGAAVNTATAAVPAATRTAGQAVAKAAGTAKAAANGTAKSAASTAKAAAGTAAGRAKTASGGARSAGAVAAGTARSAGGAAAGTARSAAKKSVPARKAPAKKKPAARKSGTGSASGSGSS